MTEIYVIITETCYIQSQTNKGTSDHKTLITQLEDECDIPIVFSSVENAREYLESQGFHKITSLIYHSNYQEVKDAPYFYKLTKYTIKSITLH